MEDPKQQWKYSYLFLLDESKAFDTANQKKLFEIVEETILEPDELHLLKILAKKLEINVKS